MKKNSLFLISFLLISAVVSAQIVNIPDANFKAALLVHNPVIDSNSDGNIQLSEASSLSDTLDVSFKGIYSLVGIEAFTAISVLNCRGNYLDSLDVSQNTALTYLNCNINFNLNTLDVSQNIGLTYLSCDGNNISTLDVSQNIGLTYLSCDSNNINTLDVSQNTALTHLTCGTNNISILDISQNTALTQIGCNYNNNISTLDVSQNTALIYINCTGNNISTLDVSQNTALTHLSCGQNNITTIDISQNTALTNLSFYITNVSTLDVSQNPLLNKLWCSDNNLSTLDVSQNPLLTYLICDGNNLSTLNVRNGNNLNFDFFKIQNNPNLLCVSVDDPVWSAANWIFIDPQTNFSADCGNCDNLNMLNINIDNTLNVSCIDSGRIWTTVSNGTLPYAYNWQPITNANIINNTQLSTAASGAYSLSVTDNVGCTIAKGVILNAPDLISDFDLIVNGFSQGFRPGLVSHFYLNAFNDGCSSISGQIQLVFSGPISYSNTSNLAPDVINNDTLTWNYNNWTYDSPNWFNGLNFMVDTTANIGDLVCFDVMITPLSGDFDTTNNVKRYCYDVVNSYDPNDKQVYPQGKCDANYVLPSQKMTYTVRFQNTGTADALDIFILDTLDANLDINTVRIVGQSHATLITEIIDTNTLKFRFDNINLPDSNANEEASHGYVIYEVAQLASLANNTLISNSAAIFFDFNEPIITNTVANTIIDVIPAYQSAVFDTILEDDTYILPNGNQVDVAGVYKNTLRSVENCDSIVIVTLYTKEAVGINDIYNTLLNLKIYPNPASNSFTVQIQEFKEQYIIEVQNVLGKKMYSARSENSNTIVTTKDWSNGVYYVLISTLKGNVLSNDKILVNHK